MAELDANSLAIVVVNYASSSLLHSNLSRTSTEFPQAKIVVVDNRSSDSERAAVLTLCRVRGWSCVEMGSNAGFGAGMNAGVTRARELGARWFLLLNPDVSIGGLDVERLLGRVRDEPMALVTPRILRPDGTLWSGGVDLYLAEGRMRSVRRRDELDGRRELWLSGACLLLSAQLWDLCGGFADDYFLYWEDVELSHRVTAAGGSLRVESGAVATHAEGGTQGVGLTSAGTAKSATYYYYNTRNRLVFAARNLSGQDIRAWIRTAPAVGREILLQGGRRQFLRPWPPVSAALRGTWDGIRWARRELRHRSGAEA